MNPGPTTEPRAADWLEGLATWTTRGFWAIADQALFAISNLIINVLLARWLSPREYGAFVTGYVVLLLVGVGHGGMLIEPMMVFGPSRFGRRFNEYLSFLLRLHVIFGVVATATLLLIGAAQYAWGASELAGTFVGLAIAAPFIYLTWLVRRACYIERKPAVAALGGAIYLVVSSVGAGLLYSTGLLTSMAAQLLMGAAACIASLVILTRVDHSWRRLMPPEEIKQLRREHWRFFWWSGSSGLLYFGQGLVFYLLLPLFGGLEASAALRAMTNFVMPLLQSDSALIVLVTPELARARRNTQELARIARWSMRLFALEGMLCWLLVAYFRHDLVRFAYGSRYSAYADLLLVLGALPIVASRVNVLSALLKVQQHVRQVFVASMAAAVVSLIIGFATMAKFGAFGAVIAMVMADVVRILAMTRYLGKSGAALGKADGDTITVGRHQSPPVLEVRR